jgi:hypothetical protein
MIQIHIINHIVIRYNVMINITYLSTSDLTATGSKHLILFFLIFLIMADHHFDSIVMAQYGSFILMYTHAHTHTHTCWYLEYDRPTAILIF